MEMLSFFVGHQNLVNPQRKSGLTDLLTNQIGHSKTRGPKECFVLTSWFRGQRISGRSIISWSYTIKVLRGSNSWTYGKPTCSKFGKRAEMETRPRVHGVHAQPGKVTFLGFLLVKTVTKFRLHCVWIAGESLGLKGNTAITHA